VSANGITTVTIPPNQSYSSTSEMIENTGIRVTATDTISLYIANEATNSFDAANVLPLDALSDKYIIQCYVPSPSGISGGCSTNVRSAFNIIATENNTIVDITPSCRTANGKSANATFTVTLNKGQMYQVMSAGRDVTGDLSGSLVQSKDCKKIAVFNGNIITGVPTSATNGYDHIFEQAMPVAFWGNKFAVTASKTRKGDFCRITALANNTEIKVNGIRHTFINERKTYEFLLSDSSCFVETSQPCAVFLYQATSEYDQSTDGDPSMLWVTPVEQQVKEITFGTFSASNTINNHYVNIVTASSDVASLTLNNNSIASQFSPLTGDTSLSFARISISHGTHTIKSNSGFTAFVYGFGYVKGYAYSIGSSAIKQTENIIVNETDPLSPSTTTNRHYCLEDLLFFRMKLNYEYDYITWNFGDGTVVKGTDTISHLYKNFGVYRVTAVITTKVQGCSGGLTDTVKGYINIQNVKTILIDTICYGQNYTKSGFVIPADSLTLIRTSMHTRTLTDRFLCDSSIILYLTVMPIYLFPGDTMVVCLNSEIYWHDKRLPTSVLGTFIIPDTLKTVQCDCDSIYTLYLTVTNTIIMEATVNDTLFCNGDSIKFDILNHTPFDNIQWEGPNHFSSSLRNPALAASFVGGSGDYIVKADSIADCFIVPDTLHITVLPEVELHPENIMLICLSDTLYSHAVNADSYLWSTGETSENILVFASGRYWIEARNERCIARDTVLVTEISTFEFEIGTKGNLCYDKVMELSVPLEGVSYKWSTGDTTAVISASEEGYYAVSIFYKTCSADQSIEIICPCSMWLPNIFTPNDDNINDVFFPVITSEVHIFRMFIYDRWGNLIFHTESLFPWDGIVNGELVSSGVYYGVIFYSCKDNPSVIQSVQSSITVVR
jgi:gliding motility-associated-like protein